MHYFICWCVLIGRDECDAPQRTDVMSASTVTEDVEEDVEFVSVSVPEITALISNLSY